MATINAYCTKTEIGTTTTWTENNSPTFSNTIILRATFNSLSNGLQITSLTFEIDSISSYSYSYSMAVYVTDDVGVAPQNYANAIFLGNVSISSGSGYKSWDFSGYMSTVSQFTGTWYVLLRVTISRSLHIYGASYGDPQAPNFTGVHQDGSAWVNDGGVWKIAVPYVNDSGVWKQAVAYVNDGGTWKQGT